jgi:hypothetical protein
MWWSSTVSSPSKTSLSQPTPGSSVNVSVNESSIMRRPTSKQRSQLTASSMSLSTLMGTLRCKSKSYWPRCGQTRSKQMPLLRMICLRKQLWNIVKPIISDSLSRWRRSRTTAYRSRLKRWHTRSRNWLWPAIRKLLTLSSSDLRRDRDVFKLFINYYHSTKKSGHPLFFMSKTA